MASSPSEQTPLLVSVIKSPASLDHEENLNNYEVVEVTSARERIYLILEGRLGKVGRAYETFTIFLILLSIASFCIGSLFDPDYNSDASYASAC
eukprot:6461730-Ditylum_brightwellii.AAC.1